MSTLNKYRKTKTSELQKTLLEYEKVLENIELIIDTHGTTKETESAKADYEIDISVIRMELNKRLFFKK